ncbi:MULTISPECIES: precorrin-6A/cobalt-precorrin-6A reductase [Prochlorococcus]|nr:MULTISPECIES: precorrin-6A/cobalt-precorrin-6A reductase [Prochlorococcus]KGG11179.1 Cobalt-precorrin-6x reductase [Prochlorococcus marinus str. LG]KGG36802.1 Cobalt-precorrin-6x reductase [Prochlorococcus sp. SS52]
MRRNYHRHIWILSGTGDGPPLVRILLQNGWKVSVSVVSSQAALAYGDLPLESLWIGPLEGTQAIANVIEKARATHKGFDWIIDATHPFAQVISSNLNVVSRKHKQPLLRFDRCCKKSQNASLIKNYCELLKLNLSEERILFAIGSRHLPEALSCGRKAGATVFARVMPTVEGLRKALMCEIPQSHLAVFKPLASDEIGEIESALCRRWKITGVVARESGGSTQKIWQNISLQQGLKLWLIARPALSKNIKVVNTFAELLAEI